MKIEKYLKNYNADPITGCWNWTGAKTKGGYGHLRFLKKLTYAHRVSWIIHYGGIPNNLCVLHHCDNPGCINPDHLFIGTMADNMKDRDDKGRNGIKGKSRNKKQLCNCRELPER